MMWRNKNRLPSLGKRWLEDEGGIASIRIPKVSNRRWEAEGVLVLCAVIWMAHHLAFQLRVSEMANQGLPIMEIPTIKILIFFYLF